MTVDIEAMIARGSDEELEHYGVKGMKWGVRRYQVALHGSATKPKTVKAIKAAGKRTKRDLRTLRRDQAAGRKTPIRAFMSPSQKRVYADAVVSTMERNLNAELGRAYGKAAPRAVVVPHGKKKRSLDVHLIERNMRHSALNVGADEEDTGGFVVNLVYDGDFVVDFDIPGLTDFIAQSLIDDFMSDSELAHYGVKGMRWGVTRTKLQIAEAQGGGGGGAEEEEEEEEELTEEERKKLLDKANLTEDEAFDLPPSVIKDWIAKSAASAKAGKQLNFKEYIDAQEAKYGNLGDPKNAAKFRKANPQASSMRAVSASRSRASLRNDPDAPKAVAAKGMPRVNSDKGRSVTDSLDFKAKKVIQRSKTGTTTRTFNQAGFENSRSHTSSIDKRIGNWIERKLYDLLPNKEPSASSKATRAALARSTGIPRAGQTVASKAAPQVRPKDSGAARKVITKNGATTRTFKYDRDGKVVSRGTSTDIATQAKDWLSKTFGIGEKKPSGMPRLTSTGGTKPRPSSTQKTRISTRIENESRARDRSIRKASTSLNSAYMRERDAARQRERYRDYGTTTTRKEGDTTVKRTTYKSAPNYSRTEYTQSTGPDVPDIVAEWLKKQFGHDALTDSDHLAHWGVKGMKWGVRRSEAELAKARSVADRLADARSQDKTAIVRTGKSYATGEALAAAELKSIAKKYGTSALTNADLKQLNERLTLEKNYASLTPKQKTKLQKTLDGVNTAVKLNQKLGNPAGRAAKAIIDKKTAGSASKAAAAARMAASAAAGSSKKSKKSKKSSGDMPKAGGNLKVTLADLDAIAKISASSPSSSLSSRPSSTELVTKK